MQFEQFEGPFREAEVLGLRDMFCGDRLLLDLIECKRITPPDEPPPGVTHDEYYILGPTQESRVWRLTYDQPFAVKIRDRNLELKTVAEPSLPTRCSFTEKSEWIDEFDAEAFPTGFVPTHYLFSLLDYVIEILGDKTPEIERVENTFAADSGE